MRYRLWNCLKITTLVHQVMMTVSQCWPEAMSPCSVTTTQWIKLESCFQNIFHICRYLSMGVYTIWWFLPWFIYVSISHQLLSRHIHHNDAIMGAIASQITSPTIVYLTVCSDADQRKHQSSASLAFVWEIHRGPLNFPHKWPVTQKMFPFDEVIMW